MFLLANTEQVHVGWVAVATVISSGLSVFGAWLLQAWTKRHEMRLKQQQQEKDLSREEEENAIAHWQKISDRIEKDRQEQITRCDRLERRLEEVQSDLTDEKIRSNGMLVWIRHLEEILLSRTEIKFQRYTETARPRRRSKKTEVQLDTATDEEPATGDNPQ